MRTKPASLITPSNIATPPAPPPVEMREAKPIRWFRVKDGPAGNNPGTVGPFRRPSGDFFVGEPVPLVGKDLIRATWGQACCYSAMASRDLSHDSSCPTLREGTVGKEPESDSSVGAATPVKEGT